MVDTYRAVGVEVTGGHHLNGFAHPMKIDFVRDIVRVGGVRSGFEGVKPCHSCDTGTEDRLNKHNGGCWWKLRCSKYRDAVEDNIKDMKKDSVGNNVG